MPTMSAIFGDIIAGGGFRRMHSEENSCKNSRKLQGRTSRPPTGDFLDPEHVGTCVSPGVGHDDGNAPARTCRFYWRASFF